MTRTFLVIDLQEDYFPGGTLPLWQAEETEKRIVEAIDHAIAEGDRIILVQHVSAAQTGLFAANGKGISIRPSILAAAGTAPVVTKRFADAFQETDLLEKLAGTTHLLVCGMMTQNCVVFTALSNAGANFQIQVLEDLCTAPSEIVHRIALNALRSKTQVIRSTDVYGSLTI